MPGKSEQELIDQENEAAIEILIGAGLREPSSYPHVQGHRSLTYLLQPSEPNLLRALKEAGYHATWAACGAIWLKAGRDWRTKGARSRGRHVTSGRAADLRLRRRS